MSLGTGQSGSKLLLFSRRVIRFAHAPLPAPGRRVLLLFSPAPLGSAERRSRWRRARAAVTPRSALPRGHGAAPRAAPPPPVPRRRAPPRPHNATDARGHRPTDLTALLPAPRSARNRTEPLYPQTTARHARYDRRRESTERALPPADSAGGDAPAGTVRSPSVRARRRPRGLKVTGIRPRAGAAAGQREPCPPAPLLPWPGRAGPCPAAPRRAPRPPPRLSGPRGAARSRYLHAAEAHGRLPVRAHARLRPAGDVRTRRAPPAPPPLMRRERAARARRRHLGAGMRAGLPSAFSRRLGSSQTARCSGGAGRIRAAFCGRSCRGGATPPRERGPGMLSGSPGPLAAQSRWKVGFIGLERGQRAEWLRLAGTAACRACSQHPHRCRQR